MKRSKLAQKTNGTPEEDTSTSAVKVNGTSNGYHVPEPTPANQTPPPLPIPSLESLIDRHLSYLRAHATDEEYRTTLSLASDFQAPNSIGQRLYDRLKAIQTANPETWYHDLYLRNQYLVRNGSLAPYMSFFFTHPIDVPSQSQAERAALLVSTVIRYKDRLERGLIQPRIVNEEPLCMDLYKYLFSTTREPTVGIDKFVQYPKTGHFVVLRRGQVYKVGLEQVDRLERIFGRILRDTDASEVDWLGILTADDRISWAKVLHHGNCGARVLIKIAEPPVVHRHQPRKRSIHSHNRRISLCGISRRQFPGDSRRARAPLPLLRRLQPLA
jgi:hypothetical protein